MKQLLSCMWMFAAVAILMPSCKKNMATKDVTSTIMLPAGGSAVVEANNQFAFKFLQSALQNDSSTNTNKLISPLSIYLALSMVYNGADGATQDSMAAALQMEGIDINNLNAACKALIQQLPVEDNEVQLSIANSIWYNNVGLQPLQSFLDVNSNYFSAAVQGLNFNDQSSVNTINTWVSNNTQGKITQIIQTISPSDLMYLINAIYFKGGWQYAFKTSDTYNDNFNLQGGTTVNVPFMKESITTNIYYNNQLRLIELPYGGGNSYSMYIADNPTALATNPVNINQFAAGLNETGLKTAITGVQKTTVTLEMPKWESSYSIDDFRPELAALGMDIALGTSADFSKMYSSPVYISKAIHKTYIKVDEEGTTAAAVTAIGIQETDVGPASIYQLNHPFVYVIAEKQTGTILFTGILNDPSK